MQRGVALKGALARMPQGPSRPPIGSNDVNAGGSPNFNEQTGRYDMQQPQSPMNASRPAANNMAGQIPDANVYAGGSHSFDEASGRYTGSPAFNNVPQFQPVMPPQQQVPFPMTRTAYQQQPQVPNQAGAQRWQPQPFTPMMQPQQQLQPYPVNAQANPVVGTNNPLAPQSTIGANAGLYRQAIDKYKLGGNNQ
jgi:hypothetical protein